MAALREIAACSVYPALLFICACCFFWVLPPVTLVTIAVPDHCFFTLSEALLTQWSWSDKKKQTFIV